MQPVVKPSLEVVLIPECPLCGSSERYYSFLTGDERFDECRGCGLLSHKAVKGVQPDESTSYGEPREAGAADDVPPAFFPLLESYLAGAGRRLAIAGEAPAAFLAEARRRGFETTPLTEDARPAQSYDVVAAIHVLEDTPEPVAYLERLRGWLRPGGVVAVLTRQLVKPGWQAQGGGSVLGRRQRYSFSDANLETLLWKAGYGSAFLSHHLGQEVRTPDQGWRKGQGLAFGRMRERREVPRLSVVVPVFNEAATVRKVLEALAAKQIPGIELEVIVVESASTDGSREIVQEYRDTPGFHVVFEERPRGKGHAVRTGFRHVTGDLVLIQDADLEYDFLDYEMLIGPILRGRAAFVLGTRHAGHWKIRKFAESKLADAMNVAHWVLVYAMNRLYAQSMTDPFTMFKVFRTDCLAGLEFECNRFDFDVELVCKLLRKGYRPLEIPVNYQSRSFEEGKKVRIFRDPLTWVQAIMKYRTAPVMTIPVRGGEVATLPDRGRASGS